MNLLLPFSLERGRRDHQHAVGLAEPMQQGAGGNGLDGLAQAHFIGQQRAFGEREVQHPLALIRKERDFRLVRRPFAALHLQLIITPELLAFRNAAPAFEPRAKLLREAQSRHLIGSQLLERLNRLLRQPLAEGAVRIEPDLQGAWHRAVAVEQPDRIILRVGHHIQPRRAVLLRRPE